ncbi:pentapeptide repeat-containing protein [Puteibacter caeruleilacunae]|nr:pentapeptide repeat-containing protein [Puteibacter caeruleilacunae]
MEIIENYSFEDERYEFSDCLFKNCHLSELDLSGYEFTECVFESCDLSMTKFDNTLLAKAKFVDCKLIGVDFSPCIKYMFTVNFESCILNYSHFNKNKLSNTIFQNCLMREASFFDVDFSKASFPMCDLSGAVFENCNLKECDLRSAKNYSINPSNNNIKKAKFSYPDVIGLLNYFEIVIE